MMAFGWVLSAMPKSTFTTSLFLIENYTYKKGEKGVKTNVDDYTQANQMGFLFLVLSPF